MTALAISDPSKLAICVDRLVWAARVLCENDLLSEISEKMMQSLTSIASNGSLGQLTEYIHRGKKRNVQFLCNVSGEWNKLAVSVGFKKGAINKRPSLFSELKSVSDDAYVFLDDQVETKLQDSLQVIQEDEDLILNSITASDKAGQLMDCLHQIQRLKTRHLEVWNKKQMSHFLLSSLLPRIAASLLPVPQGVDKEGLPKFNDSQLNSFKEYFYIMRELHLIAPQEAEICLGLSTRMNNLVRCKMLSIANSVSVAEARTFLQVENIHSPECKIKNSMLYF